MSAHSTLRSLALLVLLSGCAYGSAMGRGARMESAGDWAAAYAAYDAAAKKKPDEVEAREARERAATAMVDQTLSEAQDALAIGDFEKVVDKLATAVKYDPDRPEVFEIRNKAQEDIAKAYFRRIEANSWDDAYDIAVRTRTLFPDSEHLEKAFDDLRGHYTKGAKADLKRKKFPEALETLRTIVKFEPDRQGDIAALEQNILQAWGSDLASKASSNARFRKTGAAAVLYARAYEVAGNRDHLEKSRDLAARLEPEGKLSVSLRAFGPRNRADIVKDGLITGLDGISDTAVVPKSSKLDVRIDVAKQRCTEDDKVTPTEKDFISGQVEEPNPEWHSLTDELAAQRQTEAEATQRAEILWPDVEAAETSLRTLDDELEAARRTLTEAEGRVTEAQTQLDRSKARRDELQSRLEELRTQGATATMESVQQQLGEMGRIISEWSGEVISRSDAAAAAKRTVKGLEVDRGPADEALKRLKSGYDAIMADKSNAQSRATDLSLKLGNTSKTVWKDVHELLKYDIHDWTRTCVAPVTVTLRPRWETSKSTKEVYEPSHETKDRSHIGHVKAEVKEDLKSYPEADDALVAKGDTATIAEVVSWLEKMADDHFQTRRTNTAVALVESPVDATTELVRLYVGAQGRLDESVVNMFSAHVKQHFGLEKIELLRPTTDASD